MDEDLGKEVSSVCSAHDGALTVNGSGGGSSAVVDFVRCSAGVVRNRCRGRRECGDEGI